MWISDLSILSRNGCRLGFSLKSVMNEYSNNLIMFSLVLSCISNSPCRLSWSKISWSFIWHSAESVFGFNDKRITVNKDSAALFGLSLVMNFVVSNATEMGCKPRTNYFRSDTAATRTFWNGMQSNRKPMCGRFWVFGSCEEQIYYQELINRRPD